MSRNEIGLYIDGHLMSKMDSRFLYKLHSAEGCWPLRACQIYFWTSLDSSGCTAPCSRCSRTAKHCSLFR